MIIYRRVREVSQSKFENVCLVSKLNASVRQMISCLAPVSLCIAALSVTQSSLRCSLVINPFTGSVR